MRRRDNYLPKQVMLGRFLAKNKGEAVEERTRLHQELGDGVEEAKEWELFDEVKGWLTDPGGAGGTVEEKERFCGCGGGLVLQGANLS